MRNEPKLYLIIDENQKYYNAKDKYFTEVMFNGTWATSNQNAQDIIDVRQLANCTIKEITENEFMESMASYTTRTIIVAETLKKQLEAIMYNLPTISGINKNLSNFLKNTIDKLKFVTPMYNKFIESQENSTDMVEADYNEFIIELSKVELYECKNLTAILKSYKKDPKSINGISNKILNNGNK